MTTAGFAADALRGRRALVTGAGSGIGRATVLTLAALGAEVAAVDVDAERAVNVAAEANSAGHRTTPFVFDLARTAELAAFVDDVTRKMGSFSVLVNNAAIVGRPMLDTSLEEWRRVLDVNLTAPFVLTRELGRQMIADGAGGSIVNVSSSSAFRAVSSGGAYGASKAGLGALTRSAAWELGPGNVNVNAVAPGVTRTPLTEHAFGDAAGLDAAITAGPLANLLRRVSEPDDVANVIAFLCLPASRQITGQVIHTSAGAIVAAG